jgi:ketol-acid reductoisomerase
MKQVLAEIESGDFAREWRGEYLAGLGRFRHLAKVETQHPAEAAGGALRALMPWLEPRRLHADGPAPTK